MYINIYVKRVSNQIIVVESKKKCQILICRLEKVVFMFLLTVLLMEFFSWTKIAINFKTEMNIQIMVRWKHLVTRYPRTFKALHDTVVRDFEQWCLKVISSIKCFNYLYSRGLCQLQEVDELLELWDTIGYWVTRP